MQRLKTRPQFQAALAGETVARTAHFALHRQVQEAQDGACVVPADRAHKPLFAVQDVWLGAMVPKRWARRAVTRNALKRQIYGMAQAHAAGLPAVAHVVRLRAAFDRRQYPSAWSDALRLAVRAELEQLFGRACRAAPRQAATAPAEGARA
ncbi:ribonuclease P protein component [Comamonas granuli]|uniref:ribonuclease P protein component n=1 Tax=Comamonas granuli TaxID=290309 RepID=UPI0005A90EC3|nr:ribonuclease P protein component [Comamonas granuli]